MTGGWPVCNSNPQPKYDQQPPSRLSWCCSYSSWTAQVRPPHSSFHACLQSNQGQILRKSYNTVSVDKLWSTSLILALCFTPFISPYCVARTVTIISLTFSLFFPQFTFFSTRSHYTALLKCNKTIWNRKEISPLLHLNLLDGGLSRLFKMWKNMKPMWMFLQHTADCMASLQ